ncbi:MAG: hypothetical protein ACRD1T_20735, partial [Acidimicrobiia bacterium]
MRPENQIIGAQFGAISRDQLQGVGVSECAIDHRVARCQLIPWFPGIYRHPVVPPSRMGELTALQLWAGPESFFSHRTGAEILELDGAPQGLLEICVPLPLRYQGVKVHRIAAGDRPALIHRSGLRVAHIERVLLDLAGTVRYGTLGLAMDDALRKHLTTLARLKSALISYGARGKNGTRALRTMIGWRDDLDGKLASKFESKMRRILRRIGTLPHVAQHRVQDGAGVY